MEAFTAAIDILQKAVFAIAIGLAIGGAIKLAEAQADGNAAEKQKGINLFIAAGICALTGSILVPMLNTIFG